MKPNKTKLLWTLAIVAVLAAALWFGGNAPGLQGFAPQEPDPPAAQTTAQPEKTAEKPVTSPPAQQPQPTAAQGTPSAQTPKEDPKKPNSALSPQEKIDCSKEAAGGSSQGVSQGDADYSQKQGMVLDQKTGKDQYATDPVPQGKPIPQEPENAQITDIPRTCKLSVRCDSILAHSDWLDPAKIGLVPQDGVLFPLTDVTFYEGESVFNVLLREMKKAKIHMEFSDTPIYHSAYIEGIANLYEFDCGELSGWMYRVNDWFPNYGCSRYALQEGDVVEWVYTCDLGVDVGGFASIGS